MRGSLQKFLLITNMNSNTFVIKSTNSMDSVRYSEAGSSDSGNPKKPMTLWKKVLLWVVGVLISILLLIFILIWVVFPITFMLSLKIERLFMFWNIQNPPNPDFANPGKYGLKGVNNFYLPTEDSDGNGVLSIGIWQILPEYMENSTRTDVENLLREEKKLPILLYLHGVACNRILPQKSYEVMRKYFHVFAWDYRSYGDSSKFDLTESGIVHDNIQIYEWVMKRTTQDIYVWGHSLGSALSIHTVRKLYEEKNIIPKGLIIESAFSTMREEVVSTSIGKLFSWLAYFNATVLDPLEEHGFKFWSTTNIQYVKCPTMHLHAMDDNVIPWTLGEKLKNVAKERKGLEQYTYWHLFAGLHGYKHTDIIIDLNIPNYIEWFKGNCTKHAQEQPRSKNKPINSMDTVKYSEADFSDKVHPKKPMALWTKVLLWTVGALISLLLLIFILIFVVFPITFMLCLRLQRLFMFWNIQNPKNPDFSKPEKYGIKGVNNFYLPTEDLDGNGELSIGIWQILPEYLENSTRTDVENLLREEKKLPILLYLHGVACNRILPQKCYEVLRKHFHVFAWDYRSFGDSSKFDLTESGIVHDNIQIYEWVMQRTTQDIYVWGHSLGSALSIHTVRKLYEEKNIIPKGLVIESAFSTMGEEVCSTSIGRFFAWLPYFNATVLDALEGHGFKFWSTTNIQYVKCPTMHLHAMDDNVIPWTLGEKLKNAAIERKGLERYTSWHLFAGLHGYKHTEITTDLNIPNYIEWFKGNCDKYTEEQLRLRSDM